MVQRVWGVLVVRDEVDVIRICVLHHLALGCERILVLDNGSTDGTTTVLRRLAERVPLTWTSDPGAYHQGEFVTGLAREARRAEADWILPLDADEFWIAPRGLDAALDRSRETGGVRVDRVELVQRREQVGATPAGLMTMTMRAPAPSRGEAAIREFLAGERSLFEVRPDAKLALRPTRRLRVGRGAHGAVSMAGPVEDTDLLTILHAPLRSRACLARKAEHGERLEQAGYDADQGWQVRHWAASARAGTLDREWAAHAYDAGGAISVAGRRVPLVRDHRLADAVRRWVRPRPKQLAARLLQRSY